MVEAVALLLPPAGLALMAASPAYSRRELGLRTAITALCLVALGAFGPSLRATYEDQLKALEGAKAPTQVAGLAPRQADPIP